MDFDTKPPVPVAEYRAFQDIIPGINSLYASFYAIFEESLCAEANILVAGAGGGREIETLAGSPNKYTLLGVDPSHDMLEVARTYIPSDAGERVQLVQGYVEDLPMDRVFDGATSVLVMHFLPDDGSKKRYLEAIRARLVEGAHFIHVDVSIESDLEAISLSPVLTRHGAMAGLPDHVLTGPAAFACAMRAADKRCIVDPERNRALLEEAGFEVISPFFRSLWFTGWWGRAV